MALEVDTDGNNDKRMTRNMYTNKRTLDGTCVLFCVLTSPVLTDNKCILSCAVIWSK